MPKSPLERLQLGFAGAHGCPRPHLSVDGMTPAGPNLSHWPGNRTPLPWRADLSTAIALRCARASHAAQAAFLGDAELVVNDHYDTDGFGSLLAVLRPAVAFAHEELLLAAAATGDFGTWQSPRAFAIDRTIVGLGAPTSPVAAEVAAADDAAGALRRYRWLLEHAERLLREPESFATIFADERALVAEELDRGLRGDVAVQRWPALGFTLLTTTGPRHRMTLNTLAGAHRVLHAATARDGMRFRYHDRTESWFALVTTAVLPRLDLWPIAARLGELEPPRDGARWCADPPTEPIPELYFGVPAAQAYGQITRELRPSRLRADQVAGELARAFAAPLAPPGT